MILCGMSTSSSILESTSYWPPKRFFLTLSLAFFFGEPRSVTITICVGSALLTLLMFASLLNLSEKLDWLQDAYEKADPNLYGLYRRVRMISWLDTRILYTFIIPSVLLAAWCSAAVYFAACPRPDG